MHLDSEGERENLSPQSELALVSRGIDPLKPRDLQIALPLQCKKIIIATDSKEQQFVESSNSVR